MSANEEKQKKPRRPRREFSAELKTGAVKLVLVEGKSVPQVARDLDLTESALRLWVEQTKTDRGEGKPGALTPAERAELARLRKTLEFDTPAARLQEVLRRPIECTQYASEDYRRLLEERGIEHSM
jgi:transposase